MTDKINIDKTEEDKRKSNKSVQSSSPSRMAVIQKRRIKRILFIASAVLLTISFIVTILICKSCMADAEQKRQQDLTASQLKKVEGLWQYNEYTEYEFDGKGSGRMFYTKDKFFAYTYTVDKDTVALDFELEYVTDCKYTFTVEGEKMTLVGGEGTAVIGKVYELTKVEK